MKWIAFLLIAQLCLANDRPSGLPVEYHEKMLVHFTDPSREDQHQYLLKTAGGLRDRLAKNKMTIGLVYGNDLFGNPFGGLSRGITNEGSLAASLAWRPSKNAHFYISGVHQAGTSLSQRRIGNVFPVQQLSLTSTLFLNEVMAKFSLCQDRINLKIGRLNMGNDFLHSVFFYNYVSAAFNGNPAGISGNIPFTTYPIATWGAALSVLFTPEWEVRAGAYNANIKVFQNRFHGLNWTFDNTNGWIVLSELHYRYQLSKEDTGLPGRYVVGGYYQTGRTDLLRGRKYPRDYGGYFIADQMIWRFGEPGSNRGVTPWVALVMAPIERNRIPLYFDAGVVISGPDACRPNDSINFGFAYGLFAGARTYEALFELNYQWQAKPYLVITPALEYVVNPQGLGTIDNALVTGAQFLISF